jgi:hypothetical protein
MGMVDGEYFTHFINVIEREHFSGQEVASWISGQFEFYSKIQRELKIRETFLYHISGIVLDTTSANTGKYNGVAVCLERLRQALHDAHFKKNCTPLEVKTDDTHKDQIVL